MDIQNHTQKLRPINILHPLPYLRHDPTYRFADNEWCLSNSWSYNEASEFVLNWISITSGIAVVVMDWLLYSFMNVCLFSIQYSSLYHFQCDIKLVVCDLKEQRVHCRLNVWKWYASCFLAYRYMSCPSWSFEIVLLVCKYLPVLSRPKHNTHLYSKSQISIVIIFFT